jgi:CRP/FNR family transcriptional regulator, anaerobic regulatory protein
MAITISSDKFIEVFVPFRKSPDLLVAQILSCSSIKNLARGTIIYTEGAACPGIGFLLSGEIRVFKRSESGREITLYEIYPGESCILNASSILSDRPYPANATAISDIQLLLLPADVFRKLMAGCDDMRNFIFKLFIDRLSMIIELVEEVAFGRMDTRLLDYIIEKSDHGKLTTTHQSVANHLGTSREVITRLLKDLERQGKIAVSRGFIQILDLQETTSDPV